MDATRIPWWLVVLIGISTVSLAVWQSGLWKPQVRLWAGGLTLVYSALLAFAIGGDPRGIATISTWHQTEYLTVGLGSLSLLSAIMMTGRPSFRGQLIWFCMLSLANAGIAWTHCATAMIPLALLATCLVPVVLIVKDLRQGVPFAPVELLHQDFNSESESHYHVGLTAVTGLVVALLLVGTTYYAVRAESTRATPSRRHSALPARSRIRTVLNLNFDPEQSLETVAASFAGRDDLLVLLAVLLGTTLATAGIRQITLQAPDSNTNDPPQPDPLPVRD